jgi:S-DNA-T family DNA segregation ATPase FtsK/SpoIIIE
VRSVIDGVPRDTKASTAELPRRTGDLTGLVTLGLSTVLLLALISYDRNDLAQFSQPPNDPPHNWLGRIGAWGAGGLTFLLGAGSFVLIALGFGFALSRFVPALGYLRRGWRAPTAAVGLFLACLGVFDLLKGEGVHLGTSGNTSSPGGVLGEVLNHWTTYCLNRTGATMFYLVIYAVSLVFLTDFHILSWLRKLIPSRVPGTGLATEPDFATRAAPASALSKKEAATAPKRARTDEPAKSSSNPPAVTAREAARAAAAEQKQAAKDARDAEEESDDEEKDPGPSLGADLQPVPEPRFQDNSLSGSRSEPSKAVVAEGETIKASEIAEATPTNAILGRASALRSKEKPEKTAPALETAQALAADASAPVDEAEDGAASDSDPFGEPPNSSAAPLAPVPGANPNPAARGRMQVRKPKPITVASTPMIGNYQLPSLDLLHLPDLTVKPTETKEELMANSRLMVQTLAQFGIEVSPGDITRGPTITRYELHPAPGVKLEKIAGLTNNIAAALKAERINILAPVPGKSSVGVEVPNAVKTKVIMRDLLESPEWKNYKGRIPLALGKDVYGQPIIADLAEMPHVLIAGSTGSGKSVCINTIIASLLFKFGPDQLRFVMIDPKVVELQQYNALPHLVVPVVTDPKKVILALRWVVNEMEKRYQIFAKVGVRNIKAFNERPKDKPLPPKEPELPLMARKEKLEPGAEGFAVEVDEQIVVPRDEDIVIPDKLSYIVVIIDELADLMLVAPADVEMAIARITQMARAAGIHCIVATQRPSVDVITGVIKANIPARIAFQVAAKVDSRTILDQMGADKLLGKGDMLYLPPGSARLTRAQGALITDQEIQQVVDFIAAQGKPSYEVEIHQALQKAPSSVGSMSLDPDDATSSEDEELLQKCMEIIRTEKKASVSLLQRRLKLGYGRASRLMDELEDRGVVGPSKGAEPRDILVDLDGEGYDGSGQTMV